VPPAAAAAAADGNGDGTPKPGKPPRNRVHKTPKGKQQQAAAAKSGRNPAAAGSSWAAQLEAEGGCLMVPCCWQPMVAMVLISRAVGRIVTL